MDSIGAERARETPDAGGRFYVLPLSNRVARPSTPPLPRPRRRPRTDADDLQERLVARAEKLWQQAEMLEMLGHDDDAAELRAEARESERQSRFAWRGDDELPLW